MGGKQPTLAASTMMVIFFVNRVHLVSVDTLGLSEAGGSKRQGERGKRAPCNFFIFTLCIRIGENSVYVYVPHQCLVPTESVRGSWISRTGVRGVCDPPAM